MAKCVVIKGYPGWNVGDEVEVSGDRLEELSGYLEVIEPDPVQKVVEEITIKKVEVKPIEVKKVIRIRKGVN